MKIKEIVYQNRRDFTAVYICEHCGETDTRSGGYDDAYYHRNVIPKMRCGTCGNTAGDNYRPRTPKYPEGMQV